jgi:hypothetical protein
MTTTARLVLSDCESVLASIKEDMPTVLWRPRWAGLVALLRAVGHVLAKVDGTHSPEAGQVVADAWNALTKSKPEPRILWQFIEEERNNVLKTYEFGPAMNITIRPGTAHLNLATGDTYSSPSEPTTFDAFMRSGAFEGQDPLTLCRDAIEFWRAHLDKIDSLIASRLARTV